jgi:hypothetical protein
MLLHDVGEDYWSISYYFFYCINLGWFLAAMGLGGGRYTIRIPEFDRLESVYRGIEPLVNQFLKLFEVNLRGSHPIAAPVFLFPVILVCGSIGLRYFPQNSPSLFV